MFRRDAGIGPFGPVEKLRPTAWLGLGYGSCPRMRTRTAASGTSNARQIAPSVGRYGPESESFVRHTSTLLSIVGSTLRRASTQSGATFWSRTRASRIFIESPTDGA